MNNNGFLKSRAEINQATQFLADHNLVQHGLDCKNWDMARIAPMLSDGDILDMGCAGSFILHNAHRRGLKGEKHGIDLSEMNPDDKCPDAIYRVGDLMHTPYEDGKFSYITCLSVIEHEVNFFTLAKECSRLLKTGGKVIITFDYWNPKVNTDGLTMFGLKWDILDEKDLGVLLHACACEGLHLDEDIDWSLGDAVINPSYCSPKPGISYTFGMVTFTKR